MVVCKYKLSLLLDTSRVLPHFFASSWGDCEMHMGYPCCPKHIVEPKAMFTMCIQVLMYTLGSVV